MAEISTTPKVAYVYNQDEDTWHPVAGAASPDVAYSWTNTHNFNAAVTMANQLISAVGINNFADEIARNNALGPVTGRTPTAGAICFIRSTGRLEFWNTAVSPAAWTQLGTEAATPGAIVRRNSAGAVVGNITGSAASATTATTATSLATTQARRINGRQFNGEVADFIVNPTTYVTAGGTTVAGYRRIFVRNTQANPGTSSIDGIAPAIGDIYIGW